LCLSTCKFLVQSLSNRRLVNAHKNGRLVQLSLIQATTIPGRDNRTCEAGASIKPGGEASFANATPGLEPTEIGKPMKWAAAFAVYCGHLQRQAERIIFHLSFDVYHFVFRLIPGRVCFQTTNEKCQMTNGKYLFLSAVRQTHPDRHRQCRSVARLRGLGELWGVDLGLRSQSLASPQALCCTCSAGFMLAYAPQVFVASLDHPKTQMTQIVSDPCHPRFYCWIRDLVVLRPGE
jgi:hypothetical protein